MFYFYCLLYVIKLTWKGRTVKASAWIKLQHECKKIVTSNLHSNAEDFFLFLIWHHKLHFIECFNLYNHPIQLLMFITLKSFMVLSSHLPSGLMLIGFSLYLLYHSYTCHSVYMPRTSQSLSLYLINNYFVYIFLLIFPFGSLVGPIIFLIVFLFKTIFIFISFNIVVLQTMLIFLG